MSVRLRNSTTQYGLVARLLHWSSVVLLLTLIITAEGFEELEDGPEKLVLIKEHASWGLLFLAVMLSRAAWRTGNPNPVHSYSIRAWQKKAARFLHLSIYAVVISQSIIGVGNVVTAGDGVQFFDLFHTPALMAANEAAHDRFVGVHEFLSIVIYPLFAVHITAALYHQVFGVQDDDPRLPAGDTGTKRLHR